MRMTSPSGDSARTSNAANRAVPSQDLPVLQYARHLAQTFEDHKSDQTLIIVSDTGSGKTTQIPQLLLSKAFDGFFGGQRRCIAVTQPRRVAATSIAHRVAQEQQSPVGDVVGYSVRFDERTSPKTRIKYMTDGMLVRQAQSGDNGWMLLQYNLIILDEVHERSLHTDVLLGLVKKAQTRRKKFADQSGSYAPLKVIVMSATMDVQKMKSFWKDAPVLYIPGKSFPVEIMYSQNSVEDYAHAAIVSVFQIHRSYPPGDILVFVSGSEEIQDLIRRCNQLTKSLPEDLKHIAFCGLYAAMPVEQQMNVFKKTPKNDRKVIFSTNVAETSVTIPGIKYVVDSGRVKSKLYSPVTGMEFLKVQTISQSQAWQRTGRAGREQPGICFRLYSEDEFTQWPEQPVPEILRSNLASLMLQLADMGVDKPLAFPFFEPPDPQSIRSALNQLTWLGAVQQTSNGDEVVVTVTPEGKTMAQFPLDPRYSKCLIRAKVHNCTEEMATIIAMLSGDSPFLVPVNQRERATLVHQKFLSSEGDPVTYLNVWKGFKQTKGEMNWCHGHFLNRKNLETAGKIRDQLIRIMQKEKIALSSCGQGTTAVRRAFCEGMFMSAAEMQPDGSYLTLDTRKAVLLHPSSCLFSTRPACVVFDELVQTTKTYIRDLCLVENEWLDTVGKEYFLDMRKKMVERAGKVSKSPDKKKRTHDQMESETEDDKVTKVDVDPTPG